MRLTDNIEHFKNVRKDLEKKSAVRIAIAVKRWLNKLHDSRSLKKSSDKTGGHSKKSKVSSRIKPYIDAGRAKPNALKDTRGSNKFGKKKESAVSSKLKESRQSG